MFCYARSSSGTNNPARGPAAAAPAPIQEPDQEPVAGHQPPAISTRAPDFPGGSSIVARETTTGALISPVMPPAPEECACLQPRRPKRLGTPCGVSPGFLTPAERNHELQPNINGLLASLDSSTPLPLTSRQKFILAAKNV